MDSEKENLDPEGFVPLFHDPDLPASWFLGKMLEGFQGMFRIWLTSDEGQDVLRESIEPYVQLVVDKMAERLRGEMTEDIEQAVQNIDTDHIESTAQDAARDAAVEAIENATYTVEVFV